MFVLDALADDLVQHLFTVFNSNMLIFLCQLLFGFFAVDNQLAQILLVLGIHQFSNRRFLEQSQCIESQLFEFGLELGVWAWEH